MLLNQNIVCWQVKKQRMWLLCSTETKKLNVCFCLCQKTNLYHRKSAKLHMLSRYQETLGYALRDNLTFLWRWMLMLHPWAQLSHDSLLGSLEKCSRGFVFSLRITMRGICDNDITRAMKWRFCCYIKKKEHGRKIWTHIY